MNKTRKQKYQESYVSQRGCTRIIAESPDALIAQNRALELEKSGKYRQASRVWLECFDKANGEIERARIAVRRGQCISKGCTLRRGEYSGIMTGNRGVVYE